MDHKKVLRRKWKKAGLCIVCGKVEPLPSQLGCAECYARQAAYKQAMNADLSEMGFCIQCREVIKEINPRNKQLYTRCKTCRDYQNQRRSGYYQTRRSKQVEHGCFDCGEPVTVINPSTEMPFRRCRACRVSRSRRPRELQKRQSCAATG